MKKIPVDPKAKALIFDLDGTIIDTMPVHLKAYQTILAEFGIDFTPQMFEKVAGVPAKETMEIIFKEHHISADPAATAILKEEEYERSMLHLKPIANVLEVIEEYHGKLPMSVGTGGSKKLSWKALDEVGLSKYFEILVSNEDVSKFKPDPETFLRCSELMGVEPQFCQVFEDSKLGIHAAKVAGMMWTDILEYQ